MTNTIRSLVVLLTALFSSQVFAQKAAEPIDSACRAKIENLKKEGLSETNLTSASIYYSRFGKEGQNNQRYVVFAEYGGNKDNFVAEGSYKGWIKILDRETGKVEKFPMTGPQNDESMGAFSLSGSSLSLVPKSQLVRNSKASIDTCTSKKDTICLSMENKARIQSILKKDSYLFVNLPATENGDGKESKAGTNKAQEHLTKLRHTNTTSVCSALLDGVPAALGNAPTKAPGAAGGRN